MTKKNIWWEQLKHINPESADWHKGTTKIKKRKCLKCGCYWNEKYIGVEPSKYGLCSLHKGDSAHEEWGVVA